MNTWIKNKSTGKFLYVQIDTEKYGFEEKMARSIGGDCILQSSSTIAEGQNCLEFNISGLISLNAYLKKHRLSYYELTAILLRIGNVIDTMNRYLLSENDILLDSSGIFMEEDSKSIYFCVIPGLEEAFDGQLKTLIMELTVNTDLEDPEALKLGFKILKESMEPDFRYHSVMELISKGRNAEKKKALAAQAIPEAEVYDTDLPVWNTEAETENMYPDEPSAESDEEEIDMLSEEDMEELPNEPPKPRLFLTIISAQIILAAAFGGVYLLKGREFALTMLPFYIGIALCVTAYFLVDHLAARRKQKAMV